MRPFETLLLAALLPACGPGAGPSTAPPPGAPVVEDAGPAADAGGPSPDAGGPSSDAGAPASEPPVVDPPPPSRDLRCGDAPPDGAPLPPPLPTYSGGECPALAPGRNVLRSGGGDREFVLVVPTDRAADERLPLVFMWHYLGGSASSMVSHGQAQQTADRLRLIAVVPEKKGDLAIDLFVADFDPAWPYLNNASDARAEEEAVFFDDMLACVAAQYAVDDACVSTVGVSAGALWSAQLMQLRGDRLASAVLLSGGTGPATSTGFFDVRGWSGTAHAMPVLLGWGGATDACGADFHRASRNLGAALAEGGHMVMECIHNCGHSAPPVDPEVGLPLLWSFAVDHPYWLRDGESRYLSGGMPAGTPEWCAIGFGHAAARTGSCGGDGFGGESCPVPAL